MTNEQLAERLDSLEARLRDWVLRQPTPFIVAPPPTEADRLRYLQSCGLVDVPRQPY